MTCPLVRSWFCRPGVLLALVLAGTFLPASATHSQDAPKLPKVLILGDSISIGYTEPVRKQLHGKAEVIRSKANCQHTAYGLANIQTWLGQEKWDVIHFNLGIWDTHLLDAQGKLVRDETQPDLHLRHTPEKYRENLTELVQILEKTGAKLIFATTTPIMYRKGKRFEDIKAFNTVAQEVMRGRGIAINDLYGLVLPHAKEWQTPDQVHFNTVGNQQLGQRVSEKILEVLDRKKN